MTLNLWMPPCPLAKSLLEIGLPLDSLPSLGAEAGTVARQDLWTHLFNTGQLPSRGVRGHEIEDDENAPPRRLLTPKNVICSQVLESVKMGI